MDLTTTPTPEPTTDGWHRHGQLRWRVNHTGNIEFENGLSSIRPLHLSENGSGWAQRELVLAWAEALHQWPEPTVPQRRQPVVMRAG